MFVPKYQENKMSTPADEEKGFSWLSLLFSPYYYAGYGKFSKGLLFAIIGFLPLTQIEAVNADTQIEQGHLETEAEFLGYAEMDWGCMSDFIINSEKVVVEGCPENKSIYENNVGKVLKLSYKTGMVEGFKTFYFVDAAELIEVKNKV